MSSTKKIIAVLGSTGLQGGSVARELIADGTFAVRAITRNADSKAAQELKSLGAEVVTADLEDLETLKAAFRGAYGVFGVTDFWALFSAYAGKQAETQAHEEKLGRNLVDAAESEGIKHFVWSTLDHTEKYHVYHFEGKYEIDKYLKSKGIPRTSLYTSSYYNNFTLYKFLVKEGDEYILKFPVTSNAQVPSYDVNETGGWVLAALKNPEKWIGKDLHAIGQTLTPNEFAEILSKISGKKVKTNDLSEETFRSKEFHDQVGDELWANMALYPENLMPRDFELSQQAYPKASTFEEFAKRDPALKALLEF